MLADFDNVEWPPSRPLDVEIEFRRDPYLGQVYAGYQLLEASGIVKLHWRDATDHIGNPILRVDVSGRRIVYDLMDGLNWTPGSEAKNLEYFQENLAEGWYFKRSFSSDLRDWLPVGVHVESLGLNYPILPIYDPFRASMRPLDRARGSKTMRRLLRRDEVQLPFDEYEVPFGAGGPGVFMSTRLWDPAASDVRTEDEAAERHRINDDRIACVRACRQEFGPRFTGGIQDTPFARRTASTALLLRSSESRKRQFLGKVRDHQVCVATSGLHGSNGWRMGEYVAAGRAVVSETPRFEVAGLRPNVDFKVFDSPETLVTEVQALLDDPDLLQQSMFRTSRHYDEFLRPDALVRRSLQIAFGVRA